MSSGGVVASKRATCERYDQMSVRSTKQSSTLTCGYLIALVQEQNRSRAFGSSADRGQCDEILEISGKLVGPDVDHDEIVKHIQECIKRKNIRLRVKRNVNYFRACDEKLSQSILLDVFVIGSNAQEQLNRFFKITNNSCTENNLLKMTGKMEMLELAANPTSIENASPYDVNVGNLLQQQQQSLHNAPLNQINIDQPHLYGTNHYHHQYQQQSQQQRQRLIGAQKISKHRELPVDVPDSFVGVTKQSPRYPPPKPHRQVSPSIPTNSLTTFSHPSANQPYNHNAQTQQPVSPPIAPSTAANIVTHNNSLRRSKKLQQLEQSRGTQQHGNYPASRMQAAVNQAFELNEDTHGPTSGDQTSDHQQSTANNLKQQNVLKVKQSMPDLCSIYDRLQKNLNGDFNEVGGDAKLLKLLSIYNTIVQTHDKQYRLPNLTSRHVSRFSPKGVREPETYKVEDLLHSVMDMLRSEDGMTSDIVELLNILGQHEVEGACSAFDRVAKSFEIAKGYASPPAPLQPQQMQHQQQFRHQNQNMYPYPPNNMEEYDYSHEQVQMDIENNLYENSLHPLTEVDLSDGTSTKTVRIEKTSIPLGATIKSEEGSIVIGRIVHGGAAHESGLLSEGDEILEVNGINLRGKTVNDAIDILQSIKETITFTIISRNYKPIQTLENIFVKTFFKYDGRNDQYNPCKDLSFEFDRGDILAIVERQKDPSWWQARREAEDGLAGLIPSISFLKERERESNHEVSDKAYLHREKKNIVSLLFNCPRGTSPRRRKKLSSIPFGPDEIPYYEEVTTYFPTKLRKRPIILVGPKMIGQREIVAKLLQDTSRFASAVSHTSKPKGPHERDGVDFHFVTRAQFAADITAGEFIECGQYQNHYYGTSLKAMKEVVKSQKFCVHLVNTPSMFNFRQGPAGAELKPFFVFVKPDDGHPEKLRNIVASLSQPKSNIEENIKAIMAEVELIETYYMPYFDMVLKVSDVDRAYQELLEKIREVETQQQWIPTFWQETPLN